MEPDDELCLCFHVTRRKVEQFIRREQPQRESQLSDCFGAGTGCGWCRPFLSRLLREQQARSVTGSESLPSKEEYARQRAAYRQHHD